MNRFAALIDRLVFTPSRNAKLELLGNYWATTPDPDRGWALAALTGGLELPHAKPALVRAMIEARMDPMLFRWSDDFVGDLAETVALAWPAGAGPDGEAAPAEQPVRVVVPADLGERAEPVEVERDGGDFAADQRARAARIGGLDLQRDLRADGEAALV